MKNIFSLKEKIVSIKAITCLLVSLCVLNTFIIASPAATASAKTKASVKAKISSKAKALTSSNYSSGKAIIPYFYCNSKQNSAFTFSNITDNPINVTVTLYNSDGTLLTDDGSPSTGILLAPQNGINMVLNYSDKNSDSSITFTLNAHATGVIAIGDNKTYDFGYGIVQWSQNSSVLQGLVSTGVETLLDGSIYDRLYLPVNNGMPF